MTPQKIALIVCGYIIATAYLALSYGYVLMVLWGWYVVPQFGLPSLTLAIAVGLIMAFGALRGFKMPPLENPGIPQVVGAVLVGPWPLLLIGWAALQ